MGVIEAWLADLRDVLHDEPATVADVRIGVFYTAAALATGETGAAFTPRDQADTVCCPRSAGRTRSRASADRPSARKVGRA